MRSIILVRSDLLKSLHSEREPELSTEEKMRRILEERVREAKTDMDRDQARRALRDYVGVAKPSRTA